MKLYCVRHAEAANATEDFERPLTEQGQADMQQLAQYLLKQKIQISHLMHSPRLRARQTAEILAEALRPQVMTEFKTGLDENDSAEDRALDIQHWEEDSLLVGHMPFVSRLVNVLLGNDAFHHLVDFVPGTIVCLENYGEATWLIKWVLTPELVRHA